MKTFLKTVSGLASALYLASCSSGNTGYNTGNVSVDLGHAVPALANAFLGQPLHGRPSRGYAPPRGLRKAFDACPRGCRVINRGGHQIVCDPRGRHIGFIPPVGYRRGDRGYGGSQYAGGGSYYGHSQGGYGGYDGYRRGSGLQPDYESRYVRSGRDGSPNSVRDTGEIYYQTARGQTRAK